MIASAAISLVGTPFSPQGRLPGIGLDCLGVIVCAGRLAGFAVDEPVPRYRVEAADPRYSVAVSDLFDTIDIDAAQAGDVLAFSVAGQGRVHVAVLVDGGDVVHALLGRGVVREPLSGIPWTIISAHRYRGESA